MLIRQEITAIQQNDIGSKDQDSETVWVEIRNNKGKKTLVGVVYRPPNSCNSVGRSINQEIVGACNEAKAIIMEDLNFNIDRIIKLDTAALKKSLLSVLGMGSLNST